MYKRQTVQLTANLLHRFRERGKHKMNKEIEKKKAFQNSHSPQEQTYLYIRPL